MAFRRAIWTDSGFQGRVYRSGGLDMLYLTSYALFQECLELGMATGAMPPTVLRPLLNEDVVLTLEPVQVLKSGDRILLVASHTASWCLLDDLEYEIAMQARSV